MRTPTRLGAGARVICLAWWAVSTVAACDSAGDAAADVGHGGSFSEPDAVSVDGRVSDAAPPGDSGAALDARRPVADAGGPALDARQLGADAAGAAPDAFRLAPDAASPELDASSPELDAASPELDAAHPAPDAASPELDAAHPEPDAASPELDAAHPEPDAAHPAPDAAPLTPCGNGPPCAADQVCAALAGRCLPDCRLGAACPAQIPVCDDETGLCRAGGGACGDCPAGRVCAEAIGQCVADCRQPGNLCPPLRPSCDAATGQCLPEAGNTETLRVRNPSSGNDLWVKLFLPPDLAPGAQAPAIVQVPGGTGWGSQLEQSGEQAQQALSGFILVLFDPDGRGNSAGEEDQDGHLHQDGLAAVIRAVAARPQVDPGRIGLYTQSFGITMGSGALARHPDLPVRFLLDWEGPATRNDTGHCDAANTGHIVHDCADDAWWSEREAATFIRLVQVPYLRMQTDRDHAQPDNDHAILMIDHATAADHGGTGVAPWTRINDADMNVANRTYTPVDPPVWFPRDDFDRATKPVEYWTELFTLGL